MDFAESLTWLEGLRRKSGILPGTDRIRKVLSICGDPQEKLRVVHVAGTNGKGSVCAFLRAIALEAGYRVGVFSSPEPISVLQTITIDGAAIPSEAFAALCSEVRFVCEQNQIVLSEFEVITVISLLCFYRERCDLTIIECGMGGAEDATNVFSSPLCCVLTAVSLDHTAFLGQTLAEIARNKCGIIKNGSHVVTVQNQEEDVLEEIFSSAAEKGATVHFPSGNATICESNLNGTVFVLNEKRYHISLSGAFQVHNAQAALEIVRVLSEKGFNFTGEDVQNGLDTAAIPCRQEVICRDPLCILDGAHNVQGIKALAETVRFIAEKRPVIGLFGMLRDKDCAACAAILAPLFEQVVCCAPENPRALPADELAQLFEQNGTPAASFSSLKEALCKAKELATNKPLVVGGSFYLSYPVRELIK